MGEMLFAQDGTLDAGRLCGGYAKIVRRMCQSARAKATHQGVRRLFPCFFRRAGRWES